MKIYDYLVNENEVYKKTPQGGLIVGRVHKSGKGGGRKKDRHRTSKHEQEVYKQNKNNAGWNSYKNWQH
jgi:hypothetical protein